MAKPTQIKAAAAVLEEEHESALDAAKAALNVYDELRQEDVTFTVVVEMKGKLYLSYGGFRTRNEAQRWVEKTFYMPDVERGAITATYDYRHWNRNLSKADEMPEARKEWLAIQRDREAGVFKHG